MSHMSWKVWAGICFERGSEGVEHLDFICVLQSGEKVQK